MNEYTAPLVEVFSSIQGEGLLVGLRQVFIRFHGCNLSCDYCDTVSGVVPASALLERTPGRRDFEPHENPVSLQCLLDILRLWVSGWPGVHHSISLTGGEPLLNHHTLQDWLPELQKLLPVYLETNGILPHALEQLISHIDYVSMDIKIPSTSGCGDLWAKHRDFLEVARRRTVFVKVVVSDATEGWEITRSCETVAAVDPSIPCILQPVTLAGGSLGILPLKMLELQEIAARSLQEVRIIPQTHKFIDLL